MAEIAAGRDIKIGTVRAHLKAVFSKTGTRGQVELAALLARVAALIPPHDAHDAEQAGVP